MSPVGGSAARRLRGAPGRSPNIDVMCVCGRTYKIQESALDLSACPNQKCATPTRDLPKSHRVVVSEGSEQA